MCRRFFNRPIVYYAHLACSVMLLVHTQTRTYTRSHPALAGKEQPLVQLVQQQPRSSVSVCITWGVRFHTSADMQHFLTQLCDELSKRLTVSGRAARHVTVTIWKSQDVSVQPGKHLGHGACVKFSEGTRRSAAIYLSPALYGCVGELTKKLQDKHQIEPTWIRGFEIKALDLVDLASVSVGATAAQPQQVYLERYTSVPSAAVRRTEGGLAIRMPAAAAAAGGTVSGARAAVLFRQASVVELELSALQVRLSFSLVTPLFFFSFFFFFFFFFPACASSFSSAAASIEIHEHVNSSQSRLFFVWRTFGSVGLIYVRTRTDEMPEFCVSMSHRSIMMVLLVK